MANNVSAETVTVAGSKFISAEVTAYGDASTHIPGSFQVIVTGSEGSQTFAEILGGAGAVAAGVQRVTLASNDPAVTALQIIDDVVLAEDAAHASADKGIMALAVRSNAAASTSGTDGDYQPLITNTTGHLWVDASGQTLTVGSHAVTNAGTFAVQAACTNAGTFAVQAACTNAGTFAVQATCTNAGTFAVQVDGNALTALQLIDDVIATLGTTTYAEATTKGAIVGAVRRDADTTLVDTTNEIGPLQMDANGRLKVEAFSGETLPVSMTSTTITGTVAVTQSGTWDEVGINDSGNSITVDNGGTFAVQATCTNAGTFAVQAACTNAGTFAVQVDGNALTALQLIDNIVHVDDAAFTLGTHSGVMMMGFAGTQSVDANDACALACTTAGYQYIAAASGSIASGAIASGAVASGAFASGALASGSIASGAIADMIVDDAAFTPATSRVLMAGFEADEASTDSVDEGDAGAARMTLDRKLIVTPQAHTNGGCSIFRSLDIDETEEDVKTSAGQVYAVHCMNMTNAAVFLKFFNLTAANTTVGSSTPVATFPVPGNNDSDGAGFTLSFPTGWAFDTAICVAATTAVADADTGAPAANACIVNVFYK